jgi:hypothetical protein
MFTVIISKRPTKAEEEDGIGERVLFGPQTVPAASAEAAIAIVAAMAATAAPPIPIADLRSSLIQVIVRQV